MIASFDSPANSHQLQMFMDYLETGQIENCLPIMAEIWSDPNLTDPILVKMGDIYRKKALEAESSVEKGEYAQRALESFQRAVQVNPHNSTAWLRLGHFYLVFLDAYDEAIHAFEKVGGEFRQHWQYQLAIGKAYYAKKTPGDLERAIHAFLYAQELAPTEYDPLYYALTAIYDYNLTAIDKDPEFRPDFDLVTEFLNKLHILYPDESDANPEIEGIWDTIHQVYLHFLQKEENNAQLWFHLGYFAYQRQEYDSAISAFQNALEINPADRQTRFYLGQTYRYRAESQANPTSTEDFKHALKIFDAIAHDFPNFVSVWIALAELALVQNIAQDAQRYYYKALTLDPHNKLALLGLSQLNAGPELMNQITRGTQRRIEELSKIRLHIKRDHENNSIIEVEGTNGYDQNTTEELLITMEPVLQQLSTRPEFQNAIIPLELVFEDTIDPKA
jgi:cytochrome c-type biogenesis protein CcmH/NrfG